MDSDRHPLRSSLFPNVPPYLRILPVTTNPPYDPPLPPQMKQITFTAPNGISPIVEECLNNSGYNLTNSKHVSDVVTCVWETLPITEKGKDEINFSELGPGVKINQFPGLFVIGRKDYLWLSYNKLLEKHGPEHFNFLAKTYVLPDEFDNCKSVMKTSNKVMIVKPPNYYCGIGIKLIKNTVELPQKKNRTVVQEYIDRPFLINSLKFDLRIYVLVTSVSPLKAYLYEDGLVRFATKAYNNNPEDIDNKFIHITNFSVNKNNKDFVYNENPGQYEGHKWNLKTLWKYLEEELKIDWRPVWEKTKDVCIKTLLSGREEILAHTKKQMPTSENSCFKLFGFDIFLDEDLTAWLLEVNNIPSLHINTIDAAVNRPMIAEMFNIVGLTIPRSIAIKHGANIASQLSLPPGVPLHQDQRHDHNGDDAGDLNDLSPEDVRTLVTSEDELSQCRDWTRIYPTSQSNYYLQFYSSVPHSDWLLQSWEAKYGVNEVTREQGRDILRKLCGQGRHLKDI